MVKLYIYGDSFFIKNKWVDMIEVDEKDVDALKRAGYVEDVDNLGTDNEKPLD